MVHLRAFLDALPAVALSPFAFVSYIGLLILWGFYLYKKWQTRVFLKSIEELSEEDKLKVIARKSPDFAPRSGFSAPQYLRYMTIRSLTAAYLVTALVIVLITVNRHPKLTHYRRPKLTHPSA